MSLLSRISQLFRGQVKKATLPMATALEPVSTKRRAGTQTAVDVESAILKKRIQVVRKREFDKLRALRLQEISHDGQPRHSFFYTSILLKPEERESTIKKIDEIEAQMSMQWWKTDRLDSSKTP